MSDTNEVTDQNALPGNSVGAANSTDLPSWAREKLSAANNEAAKYRTERNDYRDQATAALTKVAEVESAKNAAEERASAVEKELLKYRVAVEAGVPGALIPRLQGSTEDEIKADAAALLGSLPSGSVRQNATDPSQGRGDGQGAGLSPGAAFIQKALKGL